MWEPYSAVAETTASRALCLCSPVRHPPHTLASHTMKVVGIVFLEDELEVITGGADATFLVWDLAALTLKQRFTRCSSSPMVSVSGIAETLEVQGA